MYKMTSLNDGTYTISYQIPLNGIVTASIFLMQLGGVYAEYFNNVFMDGVPEI
jgi:hypothetical protein